MKFQAGRKNALNKILIIGIMIHELIVNSMKYAFPGRSDGLITVSAIKRGDHVTFLIADNGIGIPDTVGLENSTGLGLQHVSMLTEQLKGSITMEREKGTKFILEFDV